MLTELLIRDETTASLGNIEHAFAVHVSGERISQRVPREVEEYNSRKPVVLRMLARPHDRQIESLDTEITFYPRTSIAFVKFVPLVGG